MTIVRFLRVAALGVAVAISGCASSLEELTPFPCPADQRCPDGMGCVPDVGCVSARQLHSYTPFRCLDGDTCPFGLTCSPGIGCIVAEEQTAPDGGATNSDAGAGNPSQDGGPSQNPDAGVLQKCGEPGVSAHDSCELGEFCCGEDRDGDGKADDCTNSAGIPVATVGQCYQAPSPPWCKGCGSNQECIGGGAPTHAVYPNICVDLGSGPTCVYACKSNAQCPVGFSCSDLKIQCQNDPTLCGDSARCQASGQVDTRGNPIKYCSCSTPDTKGGECPNATCGQEKKCVYTRGCVPGPQNCQ